MKNFYVLKNGKAIKDFKNKVSAFNYGKKLLSLSDIDRDVIEIKDLRTGEYFDV